MTPMHAAIFQNHGGTENITFNSEVPIPKLSPHEILVEMKFAGLNHLDLFVLQGWPGLKLPLPHIMGSDGAGIVSEVGSEVTDLKVGDRVTINPGTSCESCPECLAGHQNLCRQFSIKGENEPGTFATYFKIPEINALKIPDTMPLEIAAAAPLNFLTAWRLLVTKGWVKPGDFVLIQGAGGGVATACIQIAKLWGATVIATTSTAEKVEKAKQLGADYVINYRDMPDYAKYVFKELTQKQGVDIVVDSVGTATFNTSLKLLRTNGKLVTCGATTGPITKLNISLIFWKQLEILGSTMSNQQEFRDVMEHVFTGRLTPVIDRIFNLSEAREAEEYLQSGQQFGKVLLQSK
ncbi:MAG: zinc-binding dehydrogenase [Promethearchaeota archaeon]